MHRLARSAAVLTAVLIGAAGLAVAPAAASDVDQPGLTARITSPAEGDTTTGQVPVTIHLTAEGDVVPETVTVTITSTEEAGRARTSTAPVPVGCVPECDVTVPVDTLTFTDPGLSNPDSSLLDHWDWNFPYNNWADVTATVTGTSGTGSVVLASADPVSAKVDNPRPWLSAASSWTPVVGNSTIPVRAWIVPQGGAQADRLEVTLFGKGVERRYSFPAPPVDADGVSDLETTIPSTGLTTGNYTMRFIGFDSENRASYIKTDSVNYYTGPTVTVNRLLPTMSGGKQGALVEATVTVGPNDGFVPHRPQTVTVVLDGDPATQTFVDVPWDKYCAPSSCPTSVKVRIPVALPAKGGVPAELTPGTHTVTATYTEQVGWNGYQPLVASATTTKQVSAPGITAALTVKGPVVQNASGTLAFTLSSRAGTGAAAPQLRSWRLTGPSSSVLGTGTCTGTSCLTVTGSVSLKSLRGWYPTLWPSTNRNVPLTFTYTDSDGITRTVRLTVPVDPAITVNLAAPTTGTAGATAYATISVQQLASGYSLPGVPVILQARTAGSATWRTITTTKTAATGTVRVPIALKYNTYWRAVVPARAGWNGAGTSAQRYTKVAAKVTVSGPPSIVPIGRYYTVKATLNPVSSGRRVSVQMRQDTSSTWKTVARPATNKYGQVAASVKFGPGTWNLRVVADATTTSAAGAWSRWVTTR